MSEIFSPEVMTWIILPLLIFVARFIDVSLGTMRIIFLSRGKRYLAPLLGFVEVFIWVVIISQIVRNLSNFAGYFAYAAGFAAGNYMGIFLEEKLALGTLIIRAILSEKAHELIEHLQLAGYGVTIINAQGSTGPVTVINTVIRRKELEEVIKNIREVNPRIFYTVEEIRSVSEGVFPPSKEHVPLRLSNHRGIRKGK